MEGYVLSGAPGAVRPGCGTGAQASGSTALSILCTHLPSVGPSGAG